MEQVDNVGFDVCKRVAQKTGAMFKFEANVCKIDTADAEIIVFPDGRGRIRPKVPPSEGEKAARIAERYLHIFREVYTELGLNK